jgi:glycosyltransferase involved in cell wall biosynthesis
MRIGLIAPPWVPVPPRAYGGTEAVVDGLARGFARAGHEVRLFTTGDSSCPVSRRYSRPRADARLMNQTVSEVAHVLAAYDALGDCDIVHDHTTAGPLVGAPSFGAPVVTTIHNLLDDDLSAIYGAIGEHATIVAISHAQRACARGVPVAQVIHHGVDPVGFPVGEGRGGYLLFLGRMAPEKGAHRAIEIARRADMPLLLAAKMAAPEEHRYFEERVRPRLGPRARFLGEVGGEAKLRLLADAVALVNPIRWCEPFGLVMLEALACGTPVLAFPEGAAPEIVEHGLTGFLCTDVEEMAAAATRIGDIDRRECRSAATSYFSVTRVVHEHLELFRRVLAPEAPTAPVLRIVPRPTDSTATAARQTVRR